MQNLRRGAETKIMVSAEIIPIEPETGNAETGTKRNQQHIPLFSPLTQKV